uniref:Uncharacterized protein n=1 Tax=Meloidogyne enterolobii TaxID=390850 RepID=A0A6V7UZC7_MELEN|nr:unnamed protein product [Meloidogyne enterolobii]
MLWIYRGIRYKAIRYTGNTIKMVSIYEVDPVFTILKWYYCKLLLFYFSSP